MNRPAHDLRSQTGFTIIEVLFVLAIAGFIMLLVFEAVPALTRSSRNNQRKQDISTILRAVSQYELNNSGNFPQDCGIGPPPPKNCGTGDLSPGFPNDYFLQHAASRLTYYDPANIQLTTQTPTSRTNQNGPAGSNPTEEVQVYNYEKCTGGTATFLGAGFGDVVALYDLETGSGPPTAQCQQL